MTRTQLSAAATALSFALVASPARAYRSGVDLTDLSSTTTVRFETGSIRLQLHQELPAGLDAADVEAAILSASSAWTEPECTALSFAYDGVTTEPAQPGDGVNTIQWLFDWSWFDPLAAGATDVQYVTNEQGDWTISEADLYLNGEFDWSTTDAGRLLARDVRAVVTHELGHALGLLHPCEPNGEDGAPTCDDVPGLQGTSMYPIYSPTQAELSSDDVAGVCFLYPAAEATPQADPTPECDGSGECAEKLLPFGAACASPEECEDATCLTGAAEEPICTRPCSDTEPCPAHWSCESVAGEAACAPVPLDAGNCSFAGGHAGTASPLLLVWLLWGFRLTRRHRLEK